MLGIAASFINNRGIPTTTLLAMPRIKGKHSGLNQSEANATIIAHFGISEKLGYFVTDNAASNGTCLQHLAHEFGFNAPQRWIRCFGHVLNFLAQSVLFGNDSEAFEAELSGTATLEEL
jgi:hypothetical protein